MKSLKRYSDRRMKFLPGIMAVSVISLTASSFQDLPAYSHKFPAEKLSSSKPEFAKAENQKYFFRFKKGINVNEPRVRETIASLAIDFSNTEETYFSTLTLWEANQLKNIPFIEFVEPDLPVSVAGSEKAGKTFDYSASQVISWGAHKIGMADGEATGRTAWIIDSGIQLDHPDLNIDLGLSKSFIPSSESPSDEFGHGTQVAGILAAKNNAFGVAGVAAGAKLVSLRVMDEKGNGSISSVISALQYVSQHAKAGDVVNLSLGASPSELLDNATLAVAEKGILVVIAAGNLSHDAANYSPARVNHPNIFTVSAMKADNSYMGVSNWGNPVDYCAPGSALKSTRIGSSYGHAAGTSMAAPHVSGILLLKGKITQTQGFVEKDPDGNPDPIPKL